MHVTLANISKAQVSPYYGREIPAPGLEPDRVYQMLRSPEELAKGASTFNNMPLMGRHIIVSADDPKKEDIVGSLGTDATFEHPYLKASLVIWDAEAIAQVESGECKEISCGYRYDADMNSGHYEGLHYDGRMCNLIANHVALVPEGRAGPDVVVADSKLEDQPVKLTSKKALMAQGAIAAYVRPLVASDARLHIGAALQGVNRLNFRAKKAAIAAAIAKDAKLDADQTAGLKIALDALEKEDCGEDDDIEDMGEDEDEDEDEDELEKEADDKAKDRAKDKAKDKARDKAKDKKAKDESEEEDEDDEDEEEKEEREEKGRDKKAKDAEVEKKVEKAMDAAIKAAVGKATARMEALARAKSTVAPIIGEIVGLDSADDVYRLALDHLEIPTDGLNSVALERMVMREVARPQTAPVVAQDAAAGRSDWFAKNFPDAVKFGHG
jgi:hypothetical protein